MNGPMNPVGIKDVNEIPRDAVALLVFRPECGPQPITVIVTRQSYEVFLERIVSEGGIDPDATYEFESPTNPQGRKSRFWFRNVVGITANYDTGVVPARG